MKKIFNKIIIGMFVLVCSCFMININVQGATSNLSPTLKYSNGKLTLTINQDAVGCNIYNIRLSCYANSGVAGSLQSGTLTSHVLRSNDNSALTKGQLVYSTDFKREQGTYTCFIEMQYSGSNQSGSNCKNSSGGWKNVGESLTFSHGGTSSSSYTLTLDGNGSARFVCSNVSNNGGKVTYPASGKCSVVISNNTVTFPKVEESNFTGWNTSKNCTSGLAVGKSMTLQHSGNVTYYACYKSSSSDSSGTPEPTKKPTTKVTTAVNYTITLNGNGTKRFGCPSGFTTASTDTVGICNGRIAKNGTFTLPTVSESGFKGWSTSKDCSVKPVTGSQKVTGHQVYYACYGTSSSSSSSTSSSSTSSGSTRTVNATRWVNYSNNGFKCGQAVFIKTCTGTTCNAYDVNTQASLGTISSNYLSPDYNAVSKVCGSSADAIGDRYVFNNGNNYSCGDKLYITNCDNGICNFTKVNDKSSSGTISNDYLKFGKADALAECAKTTTEEEVEIKECSNAAKLAMRISSEYEICYSKDTSTSDIKDRLKELYVCDTSNGYYFDETYVSAIDNTEKCDSNNCKAIYNVRCTKGKSDKPTLAVSSGNVGSNNRGKVTVKAGGGSGEITHYYYSESIEDAPTSSSNVWRDTSSNTFTIDIEPGTIYIWVKDSNGNISYAVSGSVLDNNNTKTTIRKLEVMDSNGKFQTPTSTTAYNDTIKSSNYVRLSNNLMDDSEVLADGFNPFNMEYKLEVNSPTVTVYATLTSTDSKYVDGYEPRTVNLDYGVNTVLIKIQDNEGKIRTYTILVTRTDDRTSDNTLRELSVSAGKIEFNANVTEYKIEIPSNTTSVEVKSTISSDKASYVSGYEPGNVSIKGDTTVKLIKVKSQTGSTRTYVLTFVKENKDIITDKTLQLADLSIPGVYIPFEEEVANYSVSVDYETDVINVNATLKDKNSSMVFSSKRKSETAYVEGSSQGVPIEIGENFIEIKVTNSKNESSVYRITVIRKEYGLGISDDNTLKDLKVLGYDIDFEPTKKEYTVKIKQEKTLVITAVPNSNRAEVFIRGNEELTGFSTVRVKVVAENGNYETYSIDIKKDAFNKTIEIAAIVAGAVIILISSCIIIVKKKAKANKEYFEE